MRGALGAMKKIFLIVFWGLVLSLFFYWLSTQNKMDTFTLQLQGMEHLGIKSIIVKGPDFTTAFYSVPESWDSIEGLKIDIDSLSQEGTVDLTINTLNGELLILSDMPFKVGETNYITEHNSELRYVKGHW